MGVILFEIELAENSVFRYTDSGQEYFHDASVFEPCAISFGNVKSDGKLSKTSHEVVTPPNLEPIKVLRTGPGGSVAKIRVYEASPGRVTLRFSGRILSCKSTPEKATLVCEPESTSVKRLALHRNYQRPCPHMLYGHLCRAERVSTPCSVVSSSPGAWTLVSGSGLGDAEQYVGGVLEWSEGGRRHVQTVVSASDEPSGLQVVMNHFSDGQNASGVTLTRGCNHTETACADWHGNILNYGGFVFTPEKSPVNKISEYY